MRETFQCAGQAMASQSLYRKWRSQSFSDLVGQEAVVRILRNAVRDGRLAHAYLFCGPRGTGKTSAARLLAKAVNCPNVRDGEPCNECISCREIAEGRSPDVIEIDAASNNSVENIRELRGNVNVLGAGGKYKVYVLDEAHMLSASAFNALLKTLEEPPPHVIFVLATTEAHKVLPTIVSRCQRINFGRISRQAIVDRLQYVAQGEGLMLESQAADILARAAQGGLRDAVSLLDQAMAFCGSDIRADGVRAMLGVADAGAVRALVEHVATGRAAEGLQLVNEQVEAGADLRQLTAQFGELWRALMLARAGADMARILDYGPEEARELADLANQFSLDELTACARVFAASDTPARGLPVPQLGLELAFLECLGIHRRGGMVAPAISAPAVRGATSDLASPPTPPAAPPLAAAAEPLRAAASASLPMTAPATSSQRPSGTMPRPDVPLVASEADELTLEEVDNGADPQVTRGAAASTRPGAAVPASPSSDTAASHLEHEPAAGNGAFEPAALEMPAPADAGQQGRPAARSSNPSLPSPNQWQLIKKVCKQKKHTVAALLSSTQIAEVLDGDPPVMVIEAKHQFHVDALRKPENREVVEWALEQVMERRYRVRLTLSDGKSSSQAGAIREGNGADGSGSLNGFVVTVAEPDGGTAASGPDEAPASAQYGSATGSAASPARASVPPAMVVGTADYDARAARSEGTDREAEANGAPPAGSRPRRASRRELEQAALADPVVSEIIRTFPAELVEVQPLEEDEADGATGGDKLGDQRRHGAD
jgi:DNA polymerase III subunit gamma/tau